MLIAIFKLVKGLLLLAVGIGALTLLNKNIAEQVHQALHASCRDFEALLDSVCLVVRVVA